MEDFLALQTRKIRGIFSTASHVAAAPARVLRRSATFPVSRMRKENIHFRSPNVMNRAPVDKAMRSEKNSLRIAFLAKLNYISIASSRPPEHVNRTNNELKSFEIFFAISVRPLAARFFLPPVAFEHIGNRRAAPTKQMHVFA